MTLNERFHQWLRTEPFNNRERPTLREAQCVVIADEFAIEFVEWFADNTLRVDLDGYKTFGDADETEPHTIKQLLEIYKIEKGL